MILLKISLNFDPVKEILKMKCHIYILIKKMIILWKIQMKMKTFTPPFFIHFSLSLNKKKTGGNESHDKKTKYIHASAARPLIYY